MTVSTRRSFAFLHSSPDPYRDGMPQERGLERVPVMKNQSAAASVTYATDRKTSHESRNAVGDE